MYPLQNVTNKTCYSCVCKNEFLEIKIDKSCFKLTISQVWLRGLVILPIEHKNIISSNFVS